jgi:hypothetical protein
MKQTTKWLAVGLAVAGGLASAGSSYAQSVVDFTTINPSTLNSSPDALYAGWAGATFTSTLTGLEVHATNYGSLYFVVPSAQTLNTADTKVTLTLTFNSPIVGNINWVGTPFIMNDNSTGSSTYAGYSASGNGGSDPGTHWNGNVVTETENLSAAQLTAVQAGGDAIYSFNLEVDPASFAGPPIYDVTFNSLVLSPVPEPGTMALAGLGLSGLLVFRRRK